MQFKAQTRVGVENEKKKKIVIIIINELCVHGKPNDNRPTFSSFPLSRNGLFHVQNFLDTVQLN
jgi:hypothetical protein